MKSRTKCITVLAISSLLLAAPLYAAKPDKPEKGDKEAKTLMKQERKADKQSLKEQTGPDKESRKAESEEEITGFDKQREKKAEQEQKELDKGSEQGQASREGRKKWWKFWE
jgi:hypothetical protein